MPGKDADQQRFRAPRGAEGDDHRTAYLIGKIDAISERMEQAAGRYEQALIEIVAEMRALASESKTPDEPDASYPGRI